MKAKIILGLVVFLILLSGCKEGELTRKPERKVEPTQINSTPSNISIKTRINLASLQNIVESKLPNSPIYFPKTKKKRCKQLDLLIGTKWLSCEYWGGLKKRGVFSLSGNGDSLTASVPIKFWASAKMLGIQESTDKNVNVTAFLTSKPELSSNWEFKLNPEGSFRWDSHPEIKLFGIVPVGIQSVLSGPMNKQIKKQVNLIQSEIEKMKLRDHMEQIWRSSFTPIKLSEANNLWLRIGMKEAGFSGIHIDNNILKTNIQASATTEVFMGKEPVPITPSPLPELHADTIPNAKFHMMLPMAISYEKMTALLDDLLKKGEKWTPLPDQSNVLITVKNIEVYPSGQFLAIQVDFIADLPHRIFDAEGTLFLSGKPKVNNDTREFFVQELRFTSQTNNILTDIISTALRSTIEKRISDALIISYKKQYDDLLAESNSKINHNFGNGIVSSGMVSSGKLSGIALTEDMAVIHTEVTGELEVDYGL